MRLHEIRDNYDYVMRCPECGDSRNPRHGHLLLNLMTGLFNCKRCNYSGRYPTGKLLNLVAELELDGIAVSAFKQQDDQIIVPEELHPGAGLPRKSKLDRYHKYLRGNLFDAFVMKYQEGSPSGVYLRSRDKMSFIYGERGIGYAGSGPLSSSYHEPLRIVEGPYDVIDNNHVCVFGAITQRVVTRYFTGHYIILAPDGDIWANRNYQLALNIYKILKYSIYDGVFIKGIDLLLNGKDPDEATESDILHITESELPQFTRDLGSSLFNIEISIHDEFKFSALRSNISAVAI